MAQLDPILEAWRKRALSVYPYVILNARYERVRQDGAVRDAAVLFAIGVGEDDKRRVLGVSVGLGNTKSSGAPFWRAWSSMD